SITEYYHIILDPMDRKRHVIADTGAERSIVKVAKSRIDDYISAMPDDCLRDILARINHDELDEFAMLSRRLSLLPNQTRKRAEKLKSPELIVNQKGNLEFHFSIEYHTTGHEPSKWDLTINDSFGLTKRFSRGPERSYILIDDEHTITVEQILERAADLLLRFDFNSCVFDLITIDDRFLSFFKQVSSSQSFSNFKLDSIYNNLSSDGAARFLSDILSAKAKKAYIGFSYAGSIFDEAFLVGYAKTVRLCEITLYCKEEMAVESHRVGPARFRPLKAFADSLSYFGKLIMPSLLLNTDWLIAPLQKRLRYRKQGVWQFHLTRNIGYLEMRESLGQNTDIKIVSIDSGFELETSRRFASVTCIRDEGDWWFQVQFQ
ncbi:hypothetical protein PENTCL1PPCAC_23975, partial [Pristionchus entomophagus]